MSRFGTAVRRQAGKRKDLGSIPLRLSFLFSKVVVCGHCLVTLSGEWGVREDVDDRNQCQIGRLIRRGGA